MGSAGVLVTSSSWRDFSSMALAGVEVGMLRVKWGEKEERRKGTS
jgi:hypothetical protein